MQDYKFYFLDDAGHISRAEDRRFVDDLHALDAVKAMQATQTVEIWQLAREVARVKPNDSGATPTDRLSG